MAIFLQAAGGVLLAAVLGLALQHRGKDFSLLLTIAVCAMVGLMAATFLKPVLAFFRQLEEMGSLDNQLIRILLKAAGIALVSEIAGMICADAGSPSMGKSLQMLGSAVILWLSIPVFQALLELIQEILGGI